MTALLSPCWGFVSKQYLPCQPAGQYSRKYQQGAELINSDLITFINSKEDVYEG